MPDIDQPWEEPELPGMPAPSRDEVLRTLVQAHADTVREICELRMQKARIAPRLRDLLDEEKRLVRALRPYRDRLDESGREPTAGT